ncbi:MAG: response regulator transcription factor [Planctomycetes bacterium]|nr:response regulator transcription factor [Planctomycetota bacterium]
MALDSRPRVLLADDHELVRMGLRQLLERDGGFVVVAEADTGLQLDGLLRQHDPDVLVLDLQLRDGSALERLPQLVAAFPHLAVLVLSMHDQRVYAERCLRLGAKGYLMKEEAATQVAQAIRTVAAGSTFLSPTLGDGVRSGPPIERLSDRELQVFELTGDGLPTRAVAARLELSEKTVEAHKANIKKKLALEHGTELVRLAMAWRETGGQAKR